MPTYDYKCSECSAIKELNKRIAERDDKFDCPECSAKDSMNRLVSSALVGYSITTPGGYGSSAGDGWKEVLKKVHSSPGARQTSSIL